MLHTCLFLPLCRIVVFSVPVLKDERIVVVAEQRPECTEEQVSLTGLKNTCLNYSASVFCAVTFVYLPVMITQLMSIS